MGLIPLVTPWNDPFLQACRERSAKVSLLCVLLSVCPHPLRHHLCVWKGVWDGGKEVQRAFVHQGEGEGDWAVS
jgi:hypothetical protein